jgi:peptide methionine sulfoxide reductase MsrA
MGCFWGAEVVLAVFDPSVTSYEAMLKLFWENHGRTSPRTRTATAGWAAPA